MHVLERRRVSAGWLSVEKGLVIVLAALIHTAGATESKRDPAAVRSVYNTIHEHLDPGGDLMVIANIEGLFEQALESVFKLVSLVPPDAGIDTDDVVATMDRVRTFLDAHGLMAVQGFGFSMVPRTDGLSDFKLLLARDAAAARQAFWRATVGTAPLPMNSHAYLPRDTVLVNSGTGEIGALWEMIRSGITEIGGEEKAAEFAMALEMFAATVGITADALIGSIGAESVFSIQLSSSATIPLPGEVTVTIPAPSLLIVMAVRDGQLVDTVKRMFAAQLQMELPSTTVGDATIYNLPLPVPAPVPAQITLATHGDYFLIGSTANVVAEAIDAAVKGNGLTAGEEFKQAFPNLGVNNGIRYASRRLNDVFNSVARQITAHESQAGPVTPSGMRDFSAWMEQNLDMYNAMAIYNRRAGVQVAGVTSMEGRGMMGAMLAAPVGMLAGVALPSLVQARQTAQQAHCFNNLRQLDSVKNMVAMDLELNEGAQVPEHEVIQYCGGVMPECPHGGSYTLNPVGQKPACSHCQHDWPY